jgi:D-alanyl-D-alanine carboxypeptidase (penicillin-binding protein 5/6)
MLRPAPSRLRRVIRLGLCAAALALGPRAAVAAEPFQTMAAQAILVDADTGAVLFEKAADDLMAPASMAKTMTAEVIFHEMAEGRLTREREFVISENAWRKGGGPSGGSAMFAIVHSRVTLGDLLQGIIVQSGNDAAIAAAEGISGSEEAFARKMTERARQLGLTKSVFTNATGQSDPAQKVTSREMARLALHIIRTYPAEYKIFAQKEFTWNKIRQLNRNPLLTMDVGADGLKTGFLQESGYGLVGSAVQNGQRLVLVMNGLKTARDRSAEARKLLEWGFRTFEARQLFAAGAPIGEAQVFGGDRRSVALVSESPVRILLPRGSTERIAAQIVYDGPLAAPVAKGSQVGRLRVMRGDVQALDLPLVVSEDVPVGSLTQRAFDGVLELGTGLVRRAFAR